MSIITKPKTRFYDPKDRTSKFTFEGESSQLDGEYLMRGGVCWPVQVMSETGPRLEGAAVLCGYDVDRHRIIVFEETRFLCVDHVVDPETHMVEFRGLCDWLNMCWQSYYAQSYYYHHDAVTHKKHLLEVLRSKVIEPKPHFLEAIWNETDVADNLVWHKREVRRLFYGESHVYKALEVLAIRPDAVEPSFLALRAVVWGFDQKPFRRRV